MTNQDLLTVIEEGLKNGRISPHLAAYIAGEVLGTEAHETDYIEWPGAQVQDETLMETGVVIAA